MPDTGESMVHEEDEESLVSFSTVFLALVTLFVYVLFLKPTANENETNNNNNGNNNTANNTRARERQRLRAGRRIAPQQQPQPPQAPRRRLQISENALEVLVNCHSLPPHVVSKSSSSTSGSNSTSKRSIGGFDIISENGLVAFSSTKAAAESSRIPQQQQQKEEVDPKAVSLLLRKERAKILSRLFAATHKDFGKALPAPPSKGSTFVIGISKEKHLKDASQRSSLLKVIKGLATHYTVLVVVSLEQNKSAGNSGNSSSGSYEPTQNMHSETVQLLRGDDAGTLSESILPSHRVLLAGSSKGKVALVRQLSTNIGLTVDFDADVKDELERFGYDVSIVEDWKTILPPVTTA